MGKSVYGKVCMVLRIHSICDMIKTVRQLEFVGENGGQEIIENLKRDSSYYIYNISSPFLY